MDDQPPDIVIDERFCGPPGSGNGGYVAGRLAASLGGEAEVTLRHPPPLGVPLRVVPRDGGAELLHGDRLIAEARPAKAASGLAVCPSAEDAAAAARRTFAPERHGVPGCFVCGPARAQGDGLRLHVGPLDAADTDWSGTLAAPWTPAADLADDGVVRPEFVWAALDCPSAYACGSGEGMPVILLGRQTVSIARLPRVGECCTVTAKFRGKEGRKHFADAALFGEEGERLAVGNAVWIEIDRSAMPRGA